MATTARPSHVRDQSITTLDCDVNPNFTFPAQHERAQSIAFQFPPSNFPSNDNYNFSPRRGSVPLMGTPSMVTSRPRSDSGDAMKHRQSAQEPSSVSPFHNPSPWTHPSATGRSSSSRVVGEGVAPTVLNASVRLGSDPTKTSMHTRVASELLKVPNLEPTTEDQRPTLSPPKKVVPPPPSGARPRRGHAHRRSGAISSSDVWSLMNQSAPALPSPPGADKKLAPPDTSESDKNRLSPGGSPMLSWSAPVSPGMTPGKESRCRGLSVLLIETETCFPEGLDIDAHPELLKRNSRVSFMETPEIIPRPLSSGTDCSSTPTLKGHAGADSVTSIASFGSTVAPPRISVNTNVGGNVSPTRRPHNRTRSNSQTLAKPTAALRAHSDRPSTAGAILSTPTEQKQGASCYFGSEAASSLDRPATTSPKLSEAPAQAESSMSTNPGPVKRSHKKAQSDFSPLMVSGEFQKSAGSSPDISSSPKKKKNKKVKNWAGQILGKKKKPSKKGRRTPMRSPTPPVPGQNEAAPGEYEWIATSWNESYVMMPVDTLPAHDSQVLAAQPGGIESPVIDLDAALGPFKTPVATTSSIAAAAARRRRMHSSTGRPNSGYFHRRSESMPEMQLFALEEDEDRQMEDVFEEEEEEEEGSTEDDTSSDDSSEDGDEEEGRLNGGNGLGIGIVDDARQQWARDVQSSCAIEDEDNKRLSNATITTDSPSAIVLDFAIPTPLRIPSSPRRKSAPADILTPITSPVMTAPDTSTVPVTPANQRFSLAPKPPGSPSTFHTASSNLNTPIQPEFPSDSSSGFWDPYRDYLGEPGPEMRMSADDIPSLTSSSSTMTMSLAYSMMPSTPSNLEVNTFPQMGGSLKEKKEKHKKDKKDRWTSRVWSFWKSK